MLNVDILPSEHHFYPITIPKFNRDLNHLPIALTGRFYLHFYLNSYLCQNLPARLVANNFISPRRTRAGEGRFRGYGGRTPTGPHPISCAVSPAHCGETRSKRILGGADGPRPIPSPCHPRGAGSVFDGAGGSLRKDISVSLPHPLPPPYTISLDAADR